MSTVLPSIDRATTPVDLTSDSDAAGCRRRTAPNESDWDEYRPREPVIERDPRSVRRVAAFLVALWVGVILSVRACA